MLFALLIWWPSLTCFRETHMLMCICVHRLYNIVHNSIWIFLCLYQERVNRIHYSLANKNRPSLNVNIKYIYIYLFIFYYMNFPFFRPTRTFASPSNFILSQLIVSQLFYFSFLYLYEEKRKKENRHTKTSNTYIQLNLEIFFLKLIKLAQFY